MATSEDGKKAAEEALTAVEENFNAVGMPLRYLAKQHKKLINAKKTDTFKAKIIEEQFDESGKLIGRTEREGVIYSKPLADNNTRTKALDMAYRATGKYPPEKKELTGLGGGPVEMVVKYDADGNGIKIRNPSSKSD